MIQHPDLNSTCDNSERKDHDKDLRDFNEQSFSTLTSGKSQISITTNNKEKLEILFKSLIELDVDAVVNSANEGLMGGGGVDEVIHKYAGPELKEECMKFKADKFGARCYTGEAKLTKGYNLKSKYVIHTVGPYLDDDNKTQPKLLRKCYVNSLNYVDGIQIRSIAIPPISTGYYGYPMLDASELSIRTICEWIDEKENQKKN